jgi:hypothetical protein
LSILFAEIPPEYTICVAPIYSYNDLFCEEYLGYVEFKKEKVICLLLTCRSLGFFDPLLYLEFVVSYLEADFHWNCRVRLEWEHAVFSQVYRNVD